MLYRDVHVQQVDVNDTTGPHRVREGADDATSTSCGTGRGSGTAAGRGLRPAHARRLAPDGGAPEPSDQPTLVAPVDPIDPAGPAELLLPSASTDAPGPASPTPAAVGSRRRRGTSRSRRGRGRSTRTRSSRRCTRCVGPGETASVNLYIAAQDPDGTFMLLNSLGDGNTETSSKALTSVDGVRLVDPVAKKAYLPAVTADGQCVCSPDDGATGEVRSSVWVTVTFAAPPAELTMINVTVPTFGTFTDVPVR